MINKIAHLGIAVRSIDAARVLYETVLGLPCEGEEVVASQQVRTAFFTVGETHIEFLEPTGPESPIAKFLESRGEGIHHIAYSTDNIDAQLQEAREQGLRLIHDTPIIGAGGKRVAFLHPKGAAGVLTEFCEEENHRA